MNLFGARGPRPLRPSATPHEGRGRNGTDESAVAEQGLPNETAAQERAALMEICAAAVLVADARGVVLDANLAARQLFISAGPTIVGKTLLEVTLSGDIDQLWSECRAGRPVRNVEVGGLSSSSNLIVSMAPIGRAAATLTGEPDRVMVVIRDISELRRLEMIRRDFVANVSHELRTPLASIRAMAETLQDGALEDPSVARRFLGTIVTETERLSRIAADLLILSDAESQRPEKELFNLSPLLKEVLARSQPQAERATIRLTSSIADGLIVLANPDQMEQVIVNLVDNALKYTPGGGSVSVEAAVQGEEAVVHVRDTGIGILSTDLPRIFERFYRVDKARSRQSGGTGLGLSIVKHIVEAHSGRVTVASEYNHGSVFTVSLPLYWDDGSGAERDSEAGHKENDSDDV